MIFATEVDPMTIAGATVMIVGGIAGATVSIINAWFAAKSRHEQAVRGEAIISKIDGVASNALVAKQQAEAAAKKTDDAHQKLDQIRLTTETAAKDVNGNLKTVQDELVKAMENNRSLQDTILTLTDIVKQQRTAVRATDKPTDRAVRATDKLGSPVQVEVVNTPLETRPIKTGDQR